MNNVTYQTVPEDHPTFAGHFPGAPILPGALLLDMVLHSITAATGAAPDNSEISSAKFLSPAGPGDVLEIRHDIAAGGTIRFEIMAGLRKIASGSIVPRSPA